MRLFGCSSFCISSYFVVGMLGVATVLGPSLALRRLLGELTIMFFIMGICKRAKSWCPFPVKKKVSSSYVDFYRAYFIYTCDFYWRKNLFYGARVADHSPFGG